MRIEVRMCIKCGETKEITQRHKHANNICGDCSRATAKLYQREAAIKAGKNIGVVGRKPYPGGFDTAARNKFYRLKTELEKLHYREEWKPILSRNLDVVLNDKEMLEWIKSTKDDEPKPKRIKAINKKLPDTRGMTWEEWEKLGFGTEEDN
jgi:hypothetical protein